ncbi:hypothetical protein METUNv1_02528 [Methyloversatilis universalis FAM5]|uniref:PD-(D/E)XK endonuclease-like domain-containing protein n=1 Tax=Methyloversatilis universalis (strain ATCC BAA-1314 / DSM 25237 / JCM 13912 / CCUG 52030 / FAM5) TaxID=1000565 RepID=F5RE10_METUF|nr:PD-(D/E)XK nuclease family protein [Methyloversatilis universalis]EGK71141.1 hypothetical protein METUNv1_02528 [Methyloversatilis universalis FAM5]
MSAAGLELLSLPPGPGLFGQVARILIGRHGDALADTDLLLPSMALAQPLRAALCAAAGRALFMPRLLTPDLLAQRWQGDHPTDPHSRRLLGLVAQLRRMGWLGEADLWSVARELIDLADALAEVPLQQEAELAATFARTHALHDSEALSLEARLVHAVWLADSTGTPGRARACAQALERAAAAATRPLTVLLDTLDEPPSWLNAWAARAPVLCLQVARGEGDDTLSRALAAAWPPPGQDAGALWSRAPSADDAAALRARVRLVAAQSLEQEAACAADTVSAWLAAGRRRIALVAADREAARRARALLERRQVLLADETGWKLSTTRAAATVDAFLQCLASDGYHRDLLDFVRAPYVAAGLERETRARAVAAIDDWVVRRNHVDGLHALLVDAADDLAGGPAAGLIALLADAAALMPTGNAPASFWLDRLLAAIDALQARDAMLGDVAGAQVIALLEQLRADSQGVALALSFADWRQWLNGEFEQALFRDTEIDSPVVLTPLAATRLRAFEAVYVIGADREHLAPPRPRGVLGHEGLRRELGLPDADAQATRLREDLAGLVLNAGDIVFSWQAQRHGEANLPGADLQVLDLMFQRAGVGSAIEAAPPLAEPPALAVIGVSSAPSLPPERVPQKLTASALADLMDCPYRYFARRVLHLGEEDEVEETLGKGSVGEKVHAVLLAFHTAHPRLALSSPEILADDLRRRFAEAFAGAIARNFQEHAWADRLQARAAAYVDWACAREAAGWLFEAGEQARSLSLTLPDGGALTLEGRIDRIDQGSGGRALIDYKLRAADRVKKAQQRDDLQLAFYTLLEGEAVSDAAYLALDEEVPAELAQAEPQVAAEALQSLLQRVFPALRAGAVLPANGDEAACQYCGMRGLCRKDWLA